MRYAPDHNAATRQKILGVASRLFREHGIEAVGLAKIMAEADLTVGTFYTHFKSKEALVRETLLLAVQERHEALGEALRQGDLAAAVRAYLSPEHRDAPGSGCPFAALTSEVARHPRATQQVIVEQGAPTLDLVAEHLATWRGVAVGRAEAAAFFGLLIGTLQLARATPDRAASNAILEAGVEAALRLAR
jgi:TetR/AcrR family transcriptional repressor of nem operon